MKTREIWWWIYHGCRTFGRLTSGERNSLTAHTDEKNPKFHQIWICIETQVIYSVCLKNKFFRLNYGSVLSMFMGIIMVTVLRDSIYLFCSPQLFSISIYASCQTMYVWEHSACSLLHTRLIRAQLLGHTDLLYIGIKWHLYMAAFKTN